MSINAERPATILGTFARFNRQDANLRIDFAVVCLWAFLGLDLTALAIAFSHGPEIAAALALAGY